MSRSSYSSSESETEEASLTALPEEKQAHIDSLEKNIATAERRLGTFVKR
jgi:hypothetical protein